MPDWEEAGTLPTQGNRKFVSGTFPKALHHNAIMTAIRADHELFAEALEKYGMASFFDLNELTTLVETDTGQPPEMVVVEERWPAFQFRKTGIAGGKVEELFLSPMLPAKQMAVVIYWTSPDVSGKDVVWCGDLVAVPVGGVLTESGEVVTLVCTDSAQGESLNRSVLVFSELAAEDLLASIRIYRDWESANDDNLVANVHRVVVLMV
jgi:hypothetical protein